MKDLTFWRVEFHTQTRRLKIPSVLSVGTVFFVAVWQQQPNQACDMINALFLGHCGTSDSHRKFSIMNEKNPQILTTQHRW